MRAEQSVLHGTRAAYRGGCRCDTCRDYERRSRHARREREDREALREKWRNEKRRRKDRQ